MADAITEIDLDEVHQAIVDAIQAHFPDLGLVRDYADGTDYRSKPTLPACFVELVECNPADMDPGTDQLALLCRWEARIILGFRTPAVKRAIRKLITALAAFIRLQRWGKPIGAAEIIGCYPDEFHPELEQYEIWRVEWTHILHFGNTIWKNDGTIPTDVLVGYSPSVGSGNESSYIPVFDGAGI